MGSFLVSILADLITGSSRQWLSAAEAFEAPPVCRAARRYRFVALGLFMTSSVLLLSAAVAETIAKSRSVSEIFGWSGIGCLQMCIFCGLRYASVNRKPKPEDHEWDLA